MNEKNNSALTHNAQALRRNMTKEEKKLWYCFLKKQPLSWNRQKVLGNYIVDFYCASAKLVVELDGSQHYEGTAPDYDATRDEWLRSLGLTVLRYSNYEFARNFDGICADIRIHMGLEV